MAMASPEKAERICFLWVHTPDVADAMAGTFYARSPPSFHPGASAPPPAAEAALDARDYATSPGAPAPPGLCVVQGCSFPPFPFHAAPSLACSPAIHSVSAPYFPDRSSPIGLAARERDPLPCSPSG